MENQKLYISYSTVHKIVAEVASKHIKEWKPEVMVAIGGGGFIPARILRTYVDVPILAVGIKLYGSSDKPMDRPEVVQWLDDMNLKNVKGKRVLVVDEVDDSRATLEFCVELLKKCGATEIGIMVIFNKLKQKRAQLPSDVKYFAGRDIEDVWCCFPWDAQDIDLHEERAANSVKL